MYTIDDIEEMIMSAKIMIPVEKMFTKSGEHITKKEYGELVLEELVKELRVSHTTIRRRIKKYGPID